MNEISMRQLSKIARKLRLNDHDILLVKQGSGLDDKDVIAKLADEIGITLGVYKCIILVAKDLDDLTKLDHRAMYKHGWVQIGRLAELFRRKRGIPMNTTVAEIVGVMEEDSDARTDDAAHQPVQE